MTSSRHSIRLPSYGGHKDSLKKKNVSKAILYAASHLNLIQIAIRFHENNPYGMKNPNKVTQTVRKKEQLFLHEIHRLDLIHIAMKFYPYIPYGYLVLVGTGIV